MRVFQRCVRPKSKGHFMSITSLAVALSCSWVLLPGTAVSEDTGVGPPLALAPGKAPPLAKQGPLAEPRSSDQVGFPKVFDRVCCLAGHAHICQSYIGSEAVLRASALR